MKKLIKIMVLIMLTIGSLSCQSSAEREEKKAVKVLKEYLQKKYDEEFEVGYIGVRNVGNDKRYEADIIPKSIIDTPKEFDEYYWAKGFVKITAGGLIPEDSYSRVLLNISANEFFGKKLEELFGKNYLAAINVEGHYEYSDYKREITRRSQVHKASPQGKYAPISGSIFIFGKVLNDADREGYREKIYKLVQFFKENGSFEYMDLSFHIIDERSLTDGFENDIGFKLIESFNKLEVAAEFIEYRKILLSTLDNKYNEITEDERFIKINSLNKNIIMKMNKDLIYRYSRIYHNVIRSPNFLKKEIRLSEYKLNNYEEVSNIKLLNTVKIMYKEYDEKKLYNNEWED